MSALDDLLNGASVVYDKVSNINSLNTLADAGRTISSIFSGVAPVVLGEFEFNEFEVPELISYGIDQGLATHKMPGGGRTTDVLGWTPKNISWSGMFIGEGVSARASQLETLARSGRVLGLRWGEALTSVIVESLELDYLSPREIDYRINCYVVMQPETAKRRTLLDSVVDDIKQATGIDLPASLSAVKDTVKAVQPLARGLVSLTGGSPAAIAILGGVNQASGAVNGAFNVANGQIGGFIQIGQSIGTPPAAINAVNVVTSSLSSVARLGSMMGPLQRSATMLPQPYNN